MKKKLILDTNIILRFPKILTLGESEYNVIIPTDVLRELNVKFTHNNQTLNNSLLKLVDKAISQNTVTVTDLPNNSIKQRKIRENFRLSKTDANILLYGLMQKDAGFNTIIATEDIEIIKAAQENNIRIFGIKDVVKILENKENQKNDAVLNDANEYSNNQNKNLIAGFLLGVSLTLLLGLSYMNLDKIISTINVWGTIVLAIMLGLGLFWFRENRRLAYGVAEFFAGVVTIIILFAPNFDYSQIDFSVNFGLKIFGALYIMVRGQDNIVRSINGTQLGLWLKEKINIG